MMLKTSKLALRCVIRNSVRFYRRKGPSTSHITALKGKKLLQNEKTLTLDPNPLSEVDKRFKDLKFEELNVEKSLEDVMLGYFKHSNSTFKRSTSNFKSLQNTLTAEGLADDQKSRILFDYLLNESKLEIRRLETMDKEQFRGLQECKKEDLATENEGSDRDLEEVLVSNLFKAPVENEAYLKNLDLVYEVLTDLNNRKRPVGSEVLSIEQVVEAFELAKTVPIEGRRKRGIFLAGNLIYLSGNVRMDPVNESFYIESLVNYGLYKKAYNLFETNREKVNERWWYEMGMMVALRGNYIRKFERLLAIVDEKFDGYPYISPKVLKLAIKKRLFLRDFASANALTTRLLNIVSGYGMKCSHEQEQRMINFTSESEADRYLNEIELPTSQDLLTVADYHLFKKNFDTAYEIMASYLDKTGDSEIAYQYFVVHMKLNLLRDIKALKNSLVPHMSSTIAEVCLAKLQKTFDQIVKETNVDSSICQDLLFDSVDSLVKDPLLTKTVERLIVSSLRSEDLLSPSKSFHSMLKLLLASDRETEALKVLSNMEAAFRQSEQDKARQEEHFFPEANAHHYAEFIECYSLRAARSKKQRRVCQKKVADILTRMNSLGLPYNSVFLRKLLAFYRQTDDFQKAFTVVNGILKEKMERGSPTDAERTSFYNRRDMTRSLYAEIWNLCSRFFYVYTRELQTVDIKSNYGVWNQNVSKIIESTNIRPDFSIRSLFRTMVNDDNILPDERMYFTILVTFIKKRDWEAIPGILAAMVEVHGLKISKNFSDYLRKGLERERIMIQRRERKMQDNGCQTLGRRSEISSQPLEKKDLDREPVTSDKLVEDILNLKKLKDPEDENFFLVWEALKDLQFAPSNMQELINNVRIRDEVM